MTNTLPSFASLFGDISNPDALHIKILELDSLIHPYMLKLKKSTNSEVFDASTNPFFQPAQSTSLETPPNVSVYNYDDFINIFNTYKDVNFNKALLLLYIYTGSVQKQIITQNGWTLFSIEQIFDRYKNDKDRYKNDKDRYKNDKERLWIDIGIVYQGLGHVLTLRMDIRNGELFMQPDGGSNGYEREMYYNKYVEQVPNKSMYMSIKKVLDALVNNYEYNG
jgi:hypothetical protein